VKSLTNKPKENKMSIKLTQAENKRLDELILLADALGSVAKMSKADKSAYFSLCRKWEDQQKIRAEPYFS
jgi:hypothetical protein